MKAHQAVIILIMIAVCVVPVHQTGYSQDSVSDPDVARWLDANTITLATTAPGSAYDDLLPLVDLIGEARIVALGEATHGTHEFFTMKHRMVEFLVKEMGFTIFAMEANWPEAERINHYVHTGEGDPAELLAGMYFWTWNTQEVLDLIEWVRAYNQTVPADAQVSFTGFDAQMVDVAIENVVAYLNKVDPDAVEPARDDFACLEAHHLSGHPDIFDITAYQELPLAESQQCGDSVRNVYDRFVQNQDRYTDLSNADDYTFALHNALTVVQAEEAIAMRYTSGPSPRDRYMAENVTWLLNQAGADARIILWAHNGHIMKISNATMGQHLAREYGDDYLAFGFAFDHGSFNAVVPRANQSEQYGDLLPVTVDPAPDDTIESYLRQATAPAYILDVRDIDYGEPGAKWLRYQHRLRMVGAVYSAQWADYYFNLITLENGFDGMIFIAESTPSELLTE